MNPLPNSRRQFIVNTAKATAAVTLASTILPSFARDRATTNVGYTQQPLHYKYADLDIAIDALTMEIHYTKHAAGYTKNLTDACMAEKVNTQETTLENLLSKISKYSTKMRNNAGGHYNHEFFWQSMTPNGDATQPSKELLQQINNSFGSLEAFKTQFTDAGKNRFGSGWAWLFVNAEKKLMIGSTPNQDNPLMDISDVKGTPILGLDVWEHAYYLRYQNKRADYIQAWWKVVNWNVVNTKWNEAMRK